MAEKPLDCGRTIKGKIIESSGDPLPYLNVLISNSYKHSISDSLGNYQVSQLCDGPNYLSIRQNGEILFQDTIYLSSDTTINFELNENGWRLNPFEIKADGNFESSRREKLNKEELDKKYGLTLGQILESKAGVRSLNTGSSISKPVIHGMHSNRVLVYNNGIRQEGQQWGTEHAPEIDPAVSNNIQIIKGAAAIKYGFDATGGIILIEPRSINKKPGLYGDINLAAFSNGRQVNSSAFVGGRSEKYSAFSWTLQGSFKRGGNLHTPHYFLKNTGIKEYNFSSQLNWDKKNYGFAFYYSQFNTDLGIFSGSHIGNLTDLQNAIDRQIPNDTADFSYKIDRPMQHIEHELSKLNFYFNTGSAGRLNISYGRQYNLRSEFDKHRPYDDSIAALNNPELQLELTTHSLDVVWNHNKILGLVGEIGINSIYQKNTFSGRKFIPNFENQGVGAYILERKKWNKLMIEAGFRYDVRQLNVYYWENGSIQSPKHNYDDIALNAGLKYTFNKKSIIRLNLSKTWRPPSVNELYSDGLHHGSAAIETGDAELDEERALNTSLDFEYSSNKLSFQITPHFSYFENFIYLQPQFPPELTIRGAFPSFEFKQAEAYITGLDFAGSYKPVSFFQNSLKFSLLKGYNLSDKDNLFQMPSNSFENKFSFFLRDYKVFKRNEFGLSFEYVAEQKNVPVARDYAPAPPSYYLFHLDFSTEIKTEKTAFKLFFGVNNLLNQAYRDYMNRFRYFTDEIGRNYSLRIQIPINN